MEASGNGVDHEWSIDAVNTGTGVRVSTRVSASNRISATVPEAREKPTCNNEVRFA